MNPKYPVYVISKGRSDCCYTARKFEAIGVPYRLVVEETEADDYGRFFDRSRLLIAPFHDLGQGSIPVRNFVWEHSLALGAERHWVIDDNIKRFHRLNRNQKPEVTSGTIFRIAEDFTDRYENIGLSGFNYQWFAQIMDAIPAFYLNTRIYSCILIRNDLPYRWRGKYNEDTDLSLRALKDGWCTVLFNAFLADKYSTMTLRGGNTDHVYIDGDNRLKFAKALEELHPDVVTTVWKWGRWHHNVDYRTFRKNNLIRKPDVDLANEINEFGLKLVDFDSGRVPSDRPAQPREEAAVPLTTSPVAAAQPEPPLQYRPAEPTRPKPSNGWIQCSFEFPAGKEPAPPYRSTIGLPDWGLWPVLDYIAYYERELYGWHVPIARTIVSVD